ncbi:MAG: GFA family protein [Proteobacteria bacterium]|jgi:hypothetical protein|nr:GFA family protein [Pseudomonadota bacterium]
MLRGICQCGGVQITLDAVDPIGFNCYCSICRKVAGAPFSSAVVVRPGALRVDQGSELLAKYNATANYDRWHCSCCHTAIYGEVTDQGETPLYVSAAILDPDEIKYVVFDHIFVRSLVPWYQITDDRPRHEAYPDEEA